MKEKVKLRRILALIMALAMVIGLLPGMGPVTASAAETEIEESESERSITFTAIEGTPGKSTSEGYANLIDEKYSEADGTKWCVDSFSSAYIIFSASEPISINGYSIVTGNDKDTSSQNNPKSWGLYGCKSDSKPTRNMSDWKVIDSVEGDMKLEAGKYKKCDYTLSDPTDYYNYFKLEITSVNYIEKYLDSNKNVIMKMSEFMLDYNTCNHSWTGENVTAATCSRGGYTASTCSVCGATKKEDTTSALGHDFTGGDTCSRCQAKEKYVPAKPANGDGSQSSPYQITTPEELYWFAGLVNGDTFSGITEADSDACAELMNDITINKDVVDSDGNLVCSLDDFYHTWTPIGKNSNRRFTGSFNGKGHSIYGLYINSNAADKVGLFGYVGKNSSESNCILGVNVKDSYIVGNQYVGGICGCFGEATSNLAMINCSFSGYVGSGSGYVGGLCGSASGNITIDGCTNYGIVASDKGFLGGICGIGGNNERSKVSIKNCYNVGLVKGKSHLGGICGMFDDWTEGQIKIENCYNLANIEGKSTDKCESIAGICGGSSVDSISIINCYNIGSVIIDNASHVGPINGNDAEVVNCYYLDTIKNGKMNDHGEPMTIDDFKNGKVCYLLNSSKDDDTVTWRQTIGSDSYPVYSGKIVRYYEGLGYHNFCKSQEHELIVYKETEPNCFEPGYIYKKCSKCEYVTIENDSSKPALEHYMPDGSTKCQLCNVSDAKSIEPPKTDDGVYQISTAGQLIWFQEHVNKSSNSCSDSAELVDDIRLGVMTKDGFRGIKNGNNEEISWIPIGSRWSLNPIVYKGTFDGKGHVISGLYINDTRPDSGVGLFLNIDGGTVKNLGIKDSYFCLNTSVTSGEDKYCGAICGIMESGTIKNCYSDCNIIKQGSARFWHVAGGICGQNKKGTIQDCYSISRIDTLIDYVGGICGKNTGTIDNCYYLGEHFGNISISCRDGNNVDRQQFLNGKVTYLLQGKQSSNVWGQNIDEKSYPSFYNETTAKKVYCQCGESGFVYSNEDTGNHNYDQTTGICKNCSAYQAPEQDSDGKYKISKKGHLLWFAEHVNTVDASASAKLLNDITLNEGDVSAYNGTDENNWLVWEAIGVSSSPFTGEFDGNDKTITGLYYKTLDTEKLTNAGFIGYMGQGANVHNLSLENFYISGNENVAAICGNCAGGTISACTLKQGIVDANKHVGGICGYNNQGIISECITTGEGTIRGKQRVGGICGNNQNGTISGVVNAFTVDIKENTEGIYDSENGWYFAGICGYLDAGTISDSHNTGKVFGDGKLGGICGYQRGTVENCYNSSEAVIKAKLTYKDKISDLGGISGKTVKSASSVIKDCYNEALIDAGSIPGEEVGGVCGSTLSTDAGAVTIERCYNTGKIEASSCTSVGGVCGSFDVIMNDCYNTGDINGNNYVGGICGKISGQSASIKNCYSTANVTASGYRGLICGQNEGSIISCYYKSDQQGNTVGSSVAGASKEIEAISEEAFTSGEFCYLLNSTYHKDVPVWYQTIDMQGYEVPTFTGEIVYYSKADNKYFNCMGGHDLGEARVVKATCINDGYTVQTCKKCGTEVIVTSKTDKAKGYHTLSQDGTRCTGCGMTSTEPTEPEKVGDVYQIETAGQLIWFGNLQNDNVNSGTEQKIYDAVLTDNIKISELKDGKYCGLDGNEVEPWNPIVSYKGIFDGNGHTISGLYIKKTTTDDIGLFGSAAITGQIKNLGIIDSYIEGRVRVGALCGNCNGGAIENCYNAGTVIGSSEVGGLIGTTYGNTSSKISGCYNNGTVTGSSYVGGIVGQNDKYLIDMCYNNGVVKAIGEGEESYAGGICGDIKTTSALNDNITNSYNTGTISGKGTIGGICGSGSSCVNCYNIGTIISGTGTNYNAISGKFRSYSVNCYSLEGCNTPGKEFTRNDSYEIVSGNIFHSGEIAYKLQSKQTENVWGQDLSDTNSLPVLIKSGEDKKVYAGCDGANITYSNSQQTVSHNNLDDGICDLCNYYEAAQKDSEDYFHISKAGHLLWFANYVNDGNNVYAKAKLDNDINLSAGSGRNFISIGNDYAKYKGTFDGCGHTITVCQKDSYDVALFGTVYGAKIRNLTVKGTITTSVPNAAGIAGKVFSPSNTIGNESTDYGVIENCISAVDIISNMGAEGSVAAGGHGGIVAGSNIYHYGFTIKNCAFTGSITGQYTNGCAGILAGVERTDGLGKVLIENCYVTAEFKLADNGGNVIANVNDKVSINNCYYLNGLGEAPTGAARKTADDFSSGAVTYLLNNGNTKNPVWKQNINVAETEKDSYPNFTGAIVYQNTVHDCGQNTDTHSYSNTSVDTKYINHVMDENTGMCSCNNYVFKYKISLQSAILENNAWTADSVTTLSGGGLKEFDSQVTVTAPLKPGFTFKGWYTGNEYVENAQAVCDTLSYTFEADSSKELTAVYEPSAKISLKVHGNTGEYSVNGITQTSDYDESIHAGSEVTVEYTGSGTFCYWKNASDKIVSKEKKYTFTIVNPTELTAVSVAASTEGAANTSALVEFVSDYGQIIEASTWVKNNTEGKELATPPSKIGASFKHWTIEGTNYVKADVTDIIAAIGTNNRIVLKPVFDVDSAQQFKVTVTYPSELSIDDEEKSVQAGDQVTVVAKDIKGKTFSHWSSDAAGSNVLSYNKTYKLLVQKEIILYPQYVDQNVQVEEAKPIIAVTDVIKKAEGNVYKLCFEVTRSIPEKYELLEQGLIYSVTPVGENDMKIGSNNVYSIVSTDTNPNGVFYANMNVTGHEGTTIYVRGYAVIRNNETGNTETIYSSIAEGVYESKSTNN